MASLYDVAEKAGVSKTLVSRVINQQKGVSEKSREKILQAMKELRYTPNALARSLVLQKTRTIGVVLDSLCEPYFFDLICGIEDEVFKTEYDVVFCSGRNDKTVKNRYINYFSQGRTDGLIIFGSKLDDDVIIKKLAKSNFPFIVAESDMMPMNINNVVVDNVFGSKLAVNHLWECGCRSIFHITGDLTTKAAIDRKEGFIMAMQQHGVAVHSSMIYEGGFTTDSGYQVMTEFLHKYGREKLPDAIYCGSDNTAFGVMLALREEDISVPEDVMMVGFDDDIFRESDKPMKKLTTLSQPLYKIGVSSVQILLDEIEGRTEEKQRLVYYPELLIRETTYKKDSK